MIEPKPRIVNGEPVCAGVDCPAFEDLAMETGRCRKMWRERDVDMWAGLDCIPGLRAQRDEARREICERERPIYTPQDVAASRGWAYLYDHTRS